MQLAAHCPRAAGLLPWTASDPGSLGGTVIQPLHRSLEKEEESASPTHGGE